MHWKVKAVVQTVFSHLPAGESLNYLCQKRIFRNLPLDEPTFLATVASARSHVRNLGCHGRIAIDQARFYEFGADKDLVIPLVSYCLGVNDQVLVDIRRLVRDELVVDTLRRLAGDINREFLRSPQAALTTACLDQRLATLGISYRAPCDARSTGLAGASIDYITSTSTLEHIAETDIRLILRECRRILSPDGLLGLLVDYQDHYSYADNSISAFNFLTYQDDEWSRWSPALQFQNRLRHSDYLALYDEEGFEVIADEPSGADDVQIVRQLGVARRFKEHREDDLATRSPLVALRARLVGVR